MNRLSHRSEQVVYIEDAAALGGSELRQVLPKQLEIGVDFNFGVNVDDISKYWLLDLVGPLSNIILNASLGAKEPNMLLTVIA